MNPNQINYQVTSYRPENRNEVVRLFKQFWGINQSVAESFFKWKYENCPFGENINIALLHFNNGSETKVVGMRGAGLLPLSIGNQEIVAACVGDSWIEPDHRGQGQFGTLTDALHTMLNRNGFEIILNMSASERVFQASLHHGWEQVFHSPTLSRTAPQADNHDADFRHMDELTTTTHPSKSGVILYSNQVFAEPVHSLYQQTAPFEGASTSRSIDYLGWRFLKPTQTYRFIYLFERSENHQKALPDLLGFMVIGLSIRTRDRILWIVDYLMTGQEILFEMIHFLVRQSGHSKICAHPGSDTSDWDNQWEEAGFINEKPESTGVRVLQFLPDTNADKVPLRKILREISSRELWHYRTIDLDGS